MAALRAERVESRSQVVITQQGKHSTIYRKSQIVLQVLEAT